MIVSKSFSRFTSTFQAITSKYFRFFSENFFRIRRNISLYVIGNYDYFAFQTNLCLQKLQHWHSVMASWLDEQKAFNLSGQKLLHISIQKLKILSNVGIGEIKRNDSSSPSMFRHYTAVLRAKRKQYYLRFWVRC